MDHCLVCGSDGLEPITYHAGMPVLENAVCGSFELAKAMPRGNVDLAFCGACDYVFNREYDPAKLQFTRSYDNSVSHSGVFSAFVMDLVRYLVDDCAIRGARFVEVGCGKGDFLNKLVAYEGSNSAIGFDTAYEGPPDAFEGRLHFEQRYLSDPDALPAGDVAISRYVIDYITQPVEFLRVLRMIVAGSSVGKIFVECRNAAWPLSERAFWDFPYETVAYFSARSLALALQQAGLAVTGVREVFGGQFLLAEAVPAERSGPAALPAKQLAPLVEAFRAEEDRVRSRWLRELAQARGQTKIALWGAAAKGVELVNIVDPDRALISCLVDINPAKQGGYAPGTGHPIVAPEDLPALDIGLVYVANAMYLQEIERNLRDLGQAIPLKTIGVSTHFNASAGAP